ncbi:hypothetical protein SAMN06265222_103231 [Neorhodopirellula lusitana]|uniref:Uncharacterized protein n=1 Tax=Neorhodopirellula lusitana TaxID=445327 RepID=A0ABY1PWC8_9BACT|nr:hypothetical protein [Neorhodopirellula lusitana]SMP51152.1 hypothetical protein SAMN06265222_103231 [Neorhodopirellula lusitana]
MQRSKTITRLMMFVIMGIASLTICVVACQGQGFHHPSVLSSHYGNVIVSADEVGDLCIADVQQFEVTDPACGPKFAVIVSNNSTRCVADFHVTVAATLGRLFPHSPQSTVKVGKIQPGEALQVEVTLPIEALAMGNRNGQVIGFQRVIVAIDSFDELFETDEGNNVKSFKACDIAFVAAVVPVEEAPGQIVPNAITPAAGISPAHGNLAPAAAAESGSEGTLASVSSQAPLVATPSNTSEDSLLKAVEQFSVGQFDDAAPAAE